MKSYSHPFHKESDTFLSKPESEGAIREQLAAYFFTAPHPDNQTAEQRIRHKAILRRLLHIENRAVLQLAGLDRPLMKGDLASLLRNTVSACVRLAEPEHLPLTLRCSPDYPSRRSAAFEPRLVQMAAVGMLRAACLANSGGPVTAVLSARPDSLTLTVTGEHPAADPDALEVAKETARLHGGSFLHTGSPLHTGNPAVFTGTTGLSLRTTLSGDAGRYTAPTVSELLRDTLSCVQIGFYSSLGYSS